jgi:hypothetical protein
LARTFRGNLIEVSGTLAAFIYSLFYRMIGVRIHAKLYRNLTLQADNEESKSSAAERVFSEIKISNRN